MIEINEKDFLEGKHDTLILEELAKENLVIFPSESSYAFAGCAKSKNVTKKIHSIKKETLSKPLGVITKSVELIDDFVEMNEKGKKLLENGFSSPLTILFKKKIDLPCTNNDFLGVRIPKKETTLRLCQIHSDPLTAASATILGHSKTFSPKEIWNNFGDQDFVFINGGELETKAPATFYHFEEGIIFRAGDLSLDKIKKVLQD